MKNACASSFGEFSLKFRRSRQSFLSLWMLAIVASTQQKKQTKTKRMIAGVVRTLVKTVGFVHHLLSDVSLSCKGGIAFQSKNDMVKKKKKAADALCCWDCPPRRPALPLSPLTFSYHPFNQHKHNLLWPTSCCWDEQQQHNVICKHSNLFFYSWFVCVAAFNLRLSLC